MVFETFLIFQFLHPDAIYMQKNSSESTDTAKQQKTKTPPDLGGVFVGGASSTKVEPSLFYNFKRIIYQNLNFLMFDFDILYCVRGLDLFF